MLIMKTYIITGNPHKLAELQEIFPKDINLEARSLDLPEIQSLDIDEIVEDKLRRAYEVIQAPVIVEDVSAVLASQGDKLPGPFVKFYLQALGRHALYQIGKPNDRVTITCAMGYYDGTKSEIFHGIVKGTVVKPEVEAGFGFDATVIPDGYTQTYAELGPEVKNTISHRYLAASQMANFLSLQSD
jgi:non-canonical purine NTP pyrophosphatase (RdgB/HAM1 family)